LFNKLTHRDISKNLESIRSFVEKQHQQQICSKPINQVISVQESELEYEKQQQLKSMQRAEFREEERVKRRRSLFRNQDTIKDPYIQRVVQSKFR
jgi:hypothetical protein